MKIQKSQDLRLINYKRFFAALFLTLILIGTFGVKKSWAEEGCGDLIIEDANYTRTNLIGKDSPFYYVSVSCMGKDEGRCFGKRFRLTVPLPSKQIVNFDFDRGFNPGWYLPRQGFGNPGLGHYTVTFTELKPNIQEYCSADFDVIDKTMSQITPIISPTAPTNSPFDPCKNLAGTEMGRCRACTGIDDKGQFNTPSGVQCDSKQFSNIGASCGTWTSLGCIPNDPPNLVGWIITLASGVAGGIAFLLILFGSFQIVTSGGVPEKIAGGKDIITSALIGLLFIFLSVLILKVIGVQILGIPGWQ